MKEFEETLEISEDIEESLIPSFILADEDTYLSHLRALVSIADQKSTYTASANELESFRHSESAA